MIHSYSTQGKRPYQEDVAVIKLKYSNTDVSMTETENFNRNSVDIFGVFDGHGGGDIAKAVATMMPSYFYKQNVLADNEPRPLQKYNDYIISVFDNIQNELNIKHNKSTDQGTTVCMCMIYEYKGKKFLTAVWAGDSRAIACNQNLIATSLTLDHKPDTPLEYYRITNLGGEIVLKKGDVARVNGVLAVSRSMGDFDNKKYVEHRPDIIHNLCDQKFVVVATDGLWDVMSNQAVVDFVLHALFESGRPIENKLKKDNNNIACKLANEAIARGSEDNITIIIYFIDKNIEDYMKYVAPTISAMKVSKAAKVTTNVIE